MLRNVKLDAERSYCRPAIMGRIALRFSVRLEATRRSGALAISGNWRDDISTCPGTNAPLAPLPPPPARMSRTPNRGPRTTGGERSSRRSGSCRDRWANRRRAVIYGPETGKHTQPATIYRPVPLHRPYPNLRPCSFRRTAPAPILRTAAAAKPPMNAARVLWLLSIPNARQSFSVHARQVAQPRRQGGMCALSPPLSPPGSQQPS